MPKEIENQTKETEETAKTDENASVETQEQNIEGQSSDGLDSEKIIEKLNRNQKEKRIERGFNPSLFFLCISAGFAYF